jgi:hypothetical protein
MLFDDYSAYMPTDYVPNAVDNKMGDIMRHFWLYFAKHGDTPSSAFIIALACVGVCVSVSCVCRVVSCVSCVCGGVVHATL